MLSTEGLPTSNTLNIGLFHLNDYLTKKRDIITPLIQHKIDYKNILMLGYYRNPLNYIYFNEGIIIVSLMSFGLEKAWSIENGVDVNEIRERALYLAELLKREEVIQNKLTKSTPEIFDQVIKSMIDRKLLIQSTSNQ
jgi:hypothetical protein